MNVLVTGANGLLGHHVVMELLKQQHAVHILVRSQRKIHFDLKQVTVTEGLFTDHDTLTRAARGCDAIIHIAAVTATDLLKYEDYSSINVDGAGQVIKVGEELNIPGLVYVSSANTIGFGNEQQAGDERSTLQYPFTASFYARSKAQAEQLMFKASAKPGRHVIIVNPTFMLGAYDVKPSSGKLLLMGYKHRVMFVPKGGKNFVPVHDVAVAVCNALTMGRNGERYLASGIDLSFKEYYNLQKEVGKYKQMIIELPDILLLSVAKAGDLLRRLGMKTELCTMNLRQLLIREYYSNRKAITELNMPQTGMLVAIQEAIDWFKDQNTI